MITELVVNHTSDQHPWFQRARRAPTGSPERDCYVWSDDAKGYPDARVIFSDFETSNWTWDPVAGAYFFHRFYSHQPDLNYDNPDVEAAVFEVLDFWFDLGVDGLRLDAVPYLVEREGTNCENLPETHDVLKRLRKHLDANYPDRMLLAEANQWPEDAASYFGDGDGDECHMNFHFPVMPRLFMALRLEHRTPIIDIMEQTPEPPPGGQWATFLRNHDELTLEMVTDEERDLMLRAYATDIEMRINLGIRRRLAPLLGNDRRKIELLNALLFSLPGTPVIYYGDEIGMGDNVYLGDRNGVRTPMQWSPDRNGGFSATNPHKLYLPLITEQGFHYESVNVENQQGNSSSLLSWMRQLIALRKRHRVLGRGHIEFLEPENHHVIAFVRTPADPATEREEPMLCVANLSRLAQHTELDLREFAGSVPIEVFGLNRFAPITDRPYPLTLAPYGFFWLALDDGHDDDDTGSGTAAPAAAAPRLTGTWPEVLRRRASLGRTIGRWLPGRRWFSGKGATILDVGVDDVIELRDDPAVALVIVRTSFTEGDDHRYAVPLQHLDEAAALELDQERPGTVIALIDDGAIIDAMASRDGAAAVAGAALRRRHAPWTGAARRRPPPTHRPHEARRESTRRPAVRCRAVQLVCSARRPGHRQADPPAHTGREPRRHAPDAPATNGLHERPGRRRHARCHPARRGTARQRGGRPRRHPQRERPLGVEPGPADPRDRAPRVRAGRHGRRSGDGRVDGAAGGAHGGDALRAGRRRAGVRAGSLHPAVPAIDPAEPAGVAAGDAARAAAQRHLDLTDRRRDQGDGRRRARATAITSSSSSSRCAPASSTPPASGCTETSTWGKRCGPATMWCSSISRASPGGRSANA